MKFFNKENVVIALLCFIAVGTVSNFCNLKGRKGPPRVERYQDFRKEVLDSQFRRGIKDLRDVEQRRSWQKQEFRKKDKETK